MSDFTPEPALRTCKRCGWTENAATPDMHSLLLRADSMLSLLRHRGAIRWGAPGLPDEYEVDQLIGELRRAYEGHA